MAESERTAPGPRPDALEAVFHLRSVERDGEQIRYYGESLVPDRMLVREVWPAFRRAGYDVRVARSGRNQDVLIAEPVSHGLDGIPWLNLGLFVATVLSTLFVGAVAWYYVPPSELVANPLLALQAWPFTAAVLGVLLVHESGHYVMCRYHGVDASLPYLIPFVVPFGTMGALIRMRGQMPDRKALFDIGVAGPIAGLVATVIVTAIGLSLRPMTVPVQLLDSSGPIIVFNNPPLLDLIATLLNQPVAYGDAGSVHPVAVNPLRRLITALFGAPPVADIPGKTVHPVVIGGWVGMFFTVLNLLPVGQLDGGHMLRAMLGERQETVAALVPLGLFGLAGYLYIQGLQINESVGLWAFWGVFATVLASGGSATPIDETPLGRKRLALGVLVFLFGALCFMLVPVFVVR